MSKTIEIGILIQRLEDAVAVARVEGQAALSADTLEAALDMVRKEQDAPMGSSDQAHFTDAQWDIIETLILRQIVQYNQRLFELGVVSLEFRLTEAQQRLLRTEIGNRRTKP